MSQKAEIRDAVELIERFGGIRPMAKKLDVAVTTVQGWKKRANIPPARMSVILEAAERHAIDLSGVVAGYTPSGAANENALEDTPIELNAPVSAASQKPAEASKPVSDVQARLSAQATPGQPRRGGRGPADKNMMLYAVLAALALLAAAVLLLMPGREMPELSMQEDAAPRDEQGFMGSLIPDDLDQRIATLQEQAGQVGAAAQDAARLAQEAARDISAAAFAPDASLAERMAVLEARVAELGGSPVLAGVMSRYQDLKALPEGQDLLGRTSAQVADIVAGLTPGQSVSEALDQARGEEGALAQTFEGVPANDLKAAAMLLGMSQLRSALNRDQANFESDLQLLRNLVDQENVELLAAVDKLSPHAQSGALTPGGLSGEFRSLAGDIVAASLAGEDVSIKEKAAARMNEILQVEKDGELVSGTDTQATLARTDDLLAAGDIEAALVELQGLDGQAAMAAQPFINKAQVTLLAQQLKTMLGRAIDTKAYGGAAAGITASGGLGGGTLIRDEESGLSVFKPN